MANLGKMIAMPDTRRCTPDGLVFHPVNRGVARMKVFSNDDDYAAFEATIEGTLRLYPRRILAFCVRAEPLAFRPPTP